MGQPLFLQLLIVLVNAIVRYDYFCIGSFLTRLARCTKFCIETVRNVVDIMTDEQFETVRTLYEMLGTS